MTEITDLSPTDGSNTSITGNSLDGNVANMSKMDDTLQAILGAIGRWTDSDTIASATTCNIGGKAAAYLTVSGTTTITGFGTVRTGTTRFLRFSGALTLTHNATSLILPGAANITTVAGDTAVFVSEGSGNWRCLAYQRASSPYEAIFSQATGNRTVLIESTGSAAARLEFKNTGMTNRGDTQIISTNNDLAIQVAGAESARFIGNNGGLVVGSGVTNLPTSSAFGAHLGSPDVSCSRSSTSISTSRNHMLFINPNGTVGSISTSSAATTYATSSDQRLKENFSDFDAGELIDQMAMYQYQWKVDGTTGYGPKAQELYEVFPVAVAPGNGASPEDEDFVPWGWDAAKIVPLLIKEIQSLRTRLAALEEGSA